MSDGSGDAVQVDLDGAHLRVDARPARLVSLLRGGGDDPVLTAQREGGATHTQVVPAEARHVTFLVDRELTVEASRGSDFVALSEASGRQVVVAFNGEVTAMPAGSGGDRFALGAHEALLVPADGGEPRVVPSDDLAETDQDEISAAMEAATLGTATPEVVLATEPVPATEVVPAADPVLPPAAAPAIKKGPPTTPARSGQGGQRRGKKSKKGRPQHSAKKPPIVPGAAAAAAAGAGAGAGVAGAATGSSEKTATDPPATATTGRSGGGAAGATSVRHDESYEDTPGDRRFILGAVALAALIAIVLAVFVLRGSDDDTRLATDEGSVTTEAPDAPTTAAPTTPTTATPTTASPTTTATTAAPAAPVATTGAPAAPPTTAAAPEAKYAIEPKSCVQNADNSITYTATVTNQSTVAFDYTIRVVFKDGATSVASADATVSRLAAGRSVDFTATGTPDRSLTRGGQCTVERVEPRPSGS